MIFKGGLPITTKQSVREHGYGLKNVKKVLDKYISTLDFECSDERFTVKPSISFTSDAVASVTELKS